MPVYGYDNNSTANNYNEYDSGVSAFNKVNEALLPRSDIFIVSGWIILVLFWYTFILGAVGIALLVVGYSRKKLNDRFKLYKGVAGQLESVTYAQLHKATNISKGEIADDIQKMIAHGFLPGAAIDNKEGRVYLTTRAVQLHRQNTDGTVPLYVRQGDNILNRADRALIPKSRAFTIWGSICAVFALGYITTQEYLCLAIFGGLAAALLTTAYNRKGFRDRFNMYRHAAGTLETVSFEELQTLTGIPAAKIIQDMQKMTKLGLLTGGAVDYKRERLYLTEGAARERLDNIQAQPVQQPVQPIESAENKEKNEVEELISSGRAYIKRIRQYNDVIPDTKVMSDRLYELENIIKEIFDFLDRRPEKAAELRKFMNYYLPKTEEFIQNYIRLENAPNVENAAKLKEEILVAIEHINTASRKKLNELFDDELMDVSADIAVMDAMLSQDGLSDESKI